MLASILPPPLVVDVTPTSIVSFDDVNSNTGGIVASDTESRRGLPKRPARHLPMTAQQQVERIKELEQSLKAYGSPTKDPPHGSKKRKIATPEASPAQTPSVAKMATPPAEETSNESEVSLIGDQPVSTPPKTTRTPRGHESKLNNIPKHILELMNTLNNSGIPFEKDLSYAVSNAIFELSRMPDTETLITQLRVLEREWKLNNRASLKKVEALLSRNSIVAIGGVDIPSGAI